MERVLTQEEKIRRAEEIYYRRKNSSGRVGQYATLNVGEKKDNRLIKRMFLQIFVCLSIYLVFYVIQNSNYFFSQQVINKTKEILSYDINFEELTNKALEYINKIRNLGVTIPEENQEKVNENIEEINEEKQEENTIQESKENINKFAESAKILIEANTQDTLYQEETSSISQMQEDANYIKQNYSFVKPVEGTISSRFGSRNPTTPTVPKYHTGIDIAANTGTSIIAAMEGKVTQVSSVGDYGKHLRITNGEVITLYAHCSKIYVKEGETISQGQKIAEVGATGNVTGAHLHFEIRRNNEYVDPEYILNF